MVVRDEGGTIVFIRSRQEYKDKYADLGEAIHKLMKMAENGKNIFSLFAEAEALEEVSLCAYRVMRLVKKEMGQ